MGPLYGEVILDRFKHPRYAGELDAPDAAHEDVNPLCGDRIRLELRLDGGRIGAVRHRGDACAIALASADLLAELVEGRSVGEALRVDRSVLLAALGAEIRRSRLGCVSLPLDVLRAALTGAQVSESGAAAPGRRVGWAGGPE